MSSGLEHKKTGKPSFEKLFSERLKQNLPELRELYHHIYTDHPDSKAGLERILTAVEKAFSERPENFKNRDLKKLKTEPVHWFLSNEITGMSLYVDRFCGSIANLQNKLSYFENLGVNFLHLMPLFQSPPEASDGGYSVSDFRKVDPRYGTLEDLKTLQAEMLKRDMYLMLDIVFNHTSDQHEWAIKAKGGEKKYQDYFYFFSDQHIPLQYEKNMPEIFPQAAPGSFTYIKECDKWVMSVFHNYQWDLNYTNPQVFMEMLDIVFFYANLGVDILRIDAPAFIWKETGTNCQNLPNAHILLQLLKCCVQVAAPGMALLGEAIVAPKEIMKYFGTGEKEGKECDLAYNATQMALQWDALATGDTRVMMAAQHELLKKPLGTTWITYTRCHDDIGLGYDDYMIQNAGFDPYEHRKFLKNYYSGNYPASPASGALFSVNERTGDARISGSLASLCGLEKSLLHKDESETELSLKKILLMQAQSFFIGGIPMLFYGDEAGRLNDYSYLDDESKNYDNRWMHRPIIDWDKKRTAGSPGQLIFSGTQKLIRIRKKINVLTDKKNLTWMNTGNHHVAGFLRAWDKERVYCIFNFCGREQKISWYVFKEHGMNPTRLFDYWSENNYEVKKEDDYFTLTPYSFYILEPV